jgi:hypothetical protein
MGSRVLIHYWDVTPPLRRYRLIRTGHIAIEVSCDGLPSAYLGWWPKSYTLYRHDSSEAASLVKRVKRVFEKARQRVIAHIAYVNGRCTSYYDLDAIIRMHGRAWPPTNIEREQVDTLLAFNEPAKEWRNTASAEQLLQLRAKCSGEIIEGLDVKAIAEFIQTFRANAELGLVKYHYFFRNCATVTREALNAGGANISGYGVWYPYRLWNICSRKWNWAGEAE